LLNIKLLVHHVTSRLLKFNDTAKGRVYLNPNENCFRKPTVMFDESGWATFNKEISVCFLDLTFECC